jgi:hypothetical protein
MWQFYGEFSRLGRICDKRLSHNTKFAVTEVRLARPKPGFTIKCRLARCKNLAGGRAVAEFARVNRPAEELAGAGGLEPPLFGTKNRCFTN